MKIIIKVILWLLIFPSLCFAQIEIKAEVDKKKITTDEDLVYKLIVSATDETLPRPKFPQFQGFAVISQANTSNITIKTGKRKIGAVYIFILLPKETGTLTIEPAQISTKENTYKSESFQIEVIQGEKKLIPPISPQAPEIPQEESTKEKLTL